MNDITNKNYIQEIEKNSKIFEEKMSKLNSDYIEDKYPPKKEFKKNKTDFNPFKSQKLKENQYKQIKNNKKIINTNLNTINYESKEKEDENNFYYKYNNTISNDISKKLNYEETNNDKKLIEDLRENIKEKSNKIKELTNDLKEKNKLPSQKQYDELNLAYDKISNELKLKINYIKKQEDEINNLKMKLDSIFAQNKNMKGVINKKEEEIDKLKININLLKDELKISRNKYNELDIKNKQLILDYDILNKDYISLKNEKENNKIILEEQKNNCFNLKKEIIELKKVIDNLNEKLKEKQKDLLEMS